MKTITREELKQKMDNKEDFFLVEVLGEEAYKEWHLPGAIHITVTDIEQEAPTKLPDKNKEIIVYCVSFTCMASPRAAKKLEEMGHTHVVEYSGGKADWEEAGYPKEQ